MKETVRVGAVIVNKQRDKVLLELQGRGKYWVFPKGGIDPGETELETLKREVFEETGIKHFVLDSKFKDEISYKFNSLDGWIKSTVYYFVIYTSQFGYISRPEEVLDLRWCTFAEAKKLLKFKNQNKLLDRVIDYFNGK